MSECSHKWHAATCLFCKLERERDEAKADAARLREALRGIKAKLTDESTEADDYSPIDDIDAALGEGTP